MKPLLPYKRTLLLMMLLLACSTTWVWAQPNITQVEYFIDTDPGLGRAVQIPVAASSNISNQTHNVSLTGLANGFHVLFIRSKDASGRWSITNRSNFFLTTLGSNATANIVRAEYFIDTDPGFGNAVQLSINPSTNVANQTVSISLSNVADGLHTLYVRSQDADGRWSVSNRSSFFKTSAAASVLSNITAAEYFIDNDPGFGNATAINITAGTNISNQSVIVPLNNISAGFHHFFIRTRNAAGQWSISNRSGFFKADLTALAASPVNRVEYFIDTDPGFGNAQSLPVSPGTNIADQSATIDLNSVSDGFHNLYIRSRAANGAWSISNRASFFKTSTAGLTVSPVVKAEYFIDNDPGFGRANNIPVTPGTNISNQTVLVDLSSVSAGLHVLILRSQDAQGKWSISNRQPFFRPATSSGTANNIVKAEYFVDSDPGFGNGTNIPITPGVQLADIAVPVDISIYSVGGHFLFLRTQDTQGKWSITNLGTFTRPPATELLISVGTITPSSICAGSNLTIPFTINLPYNSGNVYTAQLSNASGNFDAPVTIGTLSSSTAGSITATIPAGTAAGANYRIRILASAPADISDTSLALTINRIPAASFSIVGNNNACFGSQQYSIGSAAQGISYNWSVATGGTVSPTSGTNTVVNWDAIGTHVLTATANNACGTGNSATLTVNVVSGPPSLIPGISIAGRTLTASGLAAGASGWQWYRDNTALPTGTTQSITIPNTDFGDYSVAYTNNCGIGNRSTAVTVPIAKTNQTISFTNVPAKTFGDDPFTVSATASSGLSISSYSLVSGPATINGNTVTITGAGTIIVRATQDGNASFNAAEATQSIVVNRAAATVVISNLTHVFDSTTKQAIATTTPLGLNVTLSYNGSATPPRLAGTYNVVATISSPNFQGSSTASMVIGKASQTITLQNPGNKTFSDAAFGIMASSSAGLPVALSVQTVPAIGVASISGNSITLLGGGGTVTVQANQAGDANYLPASTATTSFTVSPPPAADVQVLALTAPANACQTGVNATISIQLRNTGTQPASNFPVSYRIGQTATVTETFTGTIAPGSNANFSFATPGIFPQTGLSYQVVLRTHLAGDERPQNDTLLASVVRHAAATFSISADTSICQGQSVVLSTTGAATTQWQNGPTSSIRTVTPATTTTYIATLTDANNCTTRQLQTTVQVRPLPTVQAGADQSILRGSSATLQASGASTYRWSNGATTASIVVAPTSTSNFVVTGTDASGCAANDTVQVQVNFSNLTVSPGFLQFGGVVVDSTRTLLLTLTNTGTLTETISAITGFAAPFSSSFSTPATLPAGTSVQIPVRFRPTAALFYQADLQLQTSAGNFNIALRGTGTNPAPAWTVVPASYSFGKVARNSFVTQPLQIRNTGNIAIRITSVSSSSTRFTGSTSGVLDIPVGGSINLNVRFNPTAVASYSGTITVRTSTPGLSLLRALVSGSGVIPGSPPGLEFVGRAPYDGESGVNPAVGQPAFYTYSVLYKHPNGVAPMAGFPKVGIDRNKDGDYADEGEDLFTMTKQGAGSNWMTGEVYSFSTFLPVGQNYGYQFFATDANGNDALLTPYKAGPIVTREVLDLHVFASDIKFSKPNPAVNEDFTVSVTINNNSPYAAANVPLRFYYKDSLFLFNDTIPFIDGKTTATVSHTLNFSPDGFYPIKVWIDSANTLGEGNLLNNYASRPVIVGDFTVPGTIDIVQTAVPSGCLRGKVTYSGRATYRGLNLVGTPPVEGAEVTINTPFVPLKTTTDINGNFYFYDDPCSREVNPEDCKGYECGVLYSYSIEITDFTLTSPLATGTVLRPCENCERIGRLQQGIGVETCPKENKPILMTAGIANFEIDRITGERICAPTVYNDTITLYVNGQLVATHLEDSIASCDAKQYNYVIPGLPIGIHEVSMNHIYTLNNQRVEKASSGRFEILPSLPDLSHKSFTSGRPTQFEVPITNKALCTGAGRFMVYLYDSLPGYREKILIDSMRVDTLIPTGAQVYVYNNPLWEPGCHNLTLVIDQANTIAELLENNNVYEFIFCVPKPDLAAGADGKGGTIKPSSSTANAGSQINFSAEAYNLGTPARSPFGVQFRANGALLGGRINITSLQTRERATVVSPPFTVPLNPCPVMITAKIDSEDEVDEASELNNFDTSYYGINIKAGRSCDDEQDNLGAGFFNENDALGTGLCVPYVAPKGVLTYFATTVRNTGSREARNVQVQFKLNGQVLGTDVVPLLRAGEAKESGFFYAFDTVGRFIINAFADYTREICEINERDNIGNIHVDVKRTIADLEVLSQYIAPSNLNPLPNQPITVVGSIVNEGDAPAPPSVVRFWVDDVQLGVDIPIDSLYPGQDTTVLATASYASGIVGPKIVKLTADIKRQVTERRKGNNEATRAIIVGAAPDFASARAEGISISPANFGVGDSVNLRYYIRNYGGDGGAAWVRFFYRNNNGEKILIDSLRIGLESNDSTRMSLRWRIPSAVGMIITEIAGAIPPEFNDLNNIDSLRFDAALPLTLLSFNGTVKPQGSLLLWRTSNEVNVKHFELERSVDGRHFTAIATIRATNGSAVHQYQYTDAEFVLLPATQLYYRLRMVDIDGTYSYSNVVLLRKDIAQVTISTYPNPVRDVVNIQLETPYAARFQLQLMDLQGRLLAQRQQTVQPGSTSLTMPTAQLPQGMYVLKLMSSDGSTREVKLIKE